MKKFTPTHSGYLYSLVFGRNGVHITHLRETKHHWVDAQGRKFSKKTGLIVGVADPREHVEDVVIKLAA